ncbi:MAG: ABC transporter permease [Chloroflexi bacterium]|nr:ABC transporter permease [Chloroflexota bacterium]
MTAYIVKRLLQMVPVLLGITIVAFVLVRLTGDPATIMLPPEAPAETVAAFRQEFGLDQPIYVQYLRFIGDALQGDFGKSLRYKEPVGALFMERLPATLELAVGAMAIAIFIGIPVGVLSAVKKNSWIDTVTRFIALFGQAVPSFYLGLILIMILAVQYRLLPTGGRGSMAQLILPAVTLGVHLLALTARFSRGAVLDVLRQEYVRTGRAKGLSERVVLGRHVMKNAMIPIVTVIGLQVGAMFSGAVVTETVFSWPGIGRLMVQAISTRDFPIVQATVMIVAVIFVMVNLIVDLTYAWLDPRIKYS